VGDFPETSYPTEATLEFKKGAQVMFVRNDLSPEKRYFNGKIGKITRFARDEIFVRCKDEPQDIAVTPVEWQNIKYSIDEDTKEIKEDVLGTFTQHPLKLAWSITIHKSQGLTFDRVVIDARSAFAHGQVYVALSRCRSFEGIVLSSRLNPSSVKTDRVVKAYSEKTTRTVPTEAHLRQSKREYQERIVRELFDFRAMNPQFAVTDAAGSGALRRPFSRRPVAVQYVRGENGGGGLIDSGQIYPATSLVLFAIGVA
jgi:ATP-dependent exoDNAse (exonuclease V) alpha subunit